jgi:hypothetical protein
VGSLPALPVRWGAMAPLIEDSAEMAGISKVT